MPAQCPPAPRFEDIAFQEGIGAWVAAGEGLADWWRGLIARGATPWDVAQDCVLWWQAAGGRRPPRWHTPHEVVFEAPVARLRDFSTTGARSGIVPTLVLPPQAGHDSCIVDYSPDQSQMRTIVEAGLTRAFSLDWIGATPATRDATIDDYLDVIDRSVEHLGGPVNLVGDCQGGWLATIYAALRPEHVHSLTIAGAPIDFHCGEPAIHAAVKHFAPTGDLWFYRSLVAAGGGVFKGEHMLNGFIMLKPDNELGRQAQLLAHVRDRAHVERYLHFEDWFKHTQDIPGAFYLWIVEHLFRDNELVRGELEVGGGLVDLSRIDCPVQLLAGATDHITPPDQVFALADAVATPPERVSRRLTSGGHLGLFMGHVALREHWPPIMAEVARHSGAVPTAAAAVAAAA
jgi:poly(3-hydroxyalkanoate) synthetase